MPNCFELTKKGETTPTTLNKLDEEICAAMGAPVDPKIYYGYWYQIIGLAIACGRGLGSPELRETVADNPQLVPVLAFLEKNYTSDAFYRSKT